MKQKSRFWELQFSVWLIIGLINFSVQFFAGHLGATIAWLNFTGMSVGGFLVTSPYRLFLKRQSFYFSRKPLGFILMLFGAALLQSLLWIAFIILISSPFAAKYSINIAQLLFNVVPLLIIVLAWDLVYQGYHLIRRYHTNEVEKWKLEAEVQKAQLGALKSQINPHFLFNALNNIRALILEDAQLAREMLTKFSDIFRHSLQYSGEKLITVAEELEILSMYFDILKLQYEDKLHYTIVSNGDVLGRNIPPMILQLLVENAIKHGIALTKEGGIVAVEVSSEDGDLLLTIKNSGTLEVKNTLEDSLGIGLSNVRERLSLIFAGKANLRIWEEPPFVTVSILIKK
jgi:two-component system LytT family sensor kinase